MQRRFGSGGIGRGWSRVGRTAVALIGVAWIVAACGESSYLAPLYWLKFRACSTDADCARDAHLFLGGPFVFPPMCVDRMCQLWDTHRCVLDEDCADVAGMSSSGWSVCRPLPDGSGGFCMRVGPSPRGWFVVGEDHGYSLSCGDSGGGGPSSYRYVCYREGEREGAVGRPPRFVCHDDGPACFCIEGGLGAEDGP